MPSRSCVTLGPVVLASPLQRADPGGVFLLERFHAVRERDELFV